MNFIDRVNSVRQTEKKATELDSKRVKGFTSTNIGASEADPTNYTTTGHGSDEEFQGLRLISRYISTSEINEKIDGFTCYSVAKLLSKVYPPLFSPPTDDQFAVYGIVARKNQVRQSQDGKKYVSMLLCDLHYEILLTIYGTAFDNYYKIRPGTLIVVCNPRLSALKSQTSVLTMSIAGQGNPIFEVGRAKDLGQCSSELNTSKSRCKNWVNLKKTEVCEFHQELKARRAMANRPEFNSVVTKLQNPMDRKRKLVVYMGGSVEWKKGLHYDNQSPGEPIYQSGPFREDPGHDRLLDTPQKKKKEELKRLEKVKAEIKIRKQLAKRPDGYMLREYDRGVLKNPEQYEGEKHEIKVFSNEDLRKIGFNPSALKQHGRRVPNKSGSTPVAENKNAADQEDSDDDLEII